MQFLDEFHVIRSDIVLRLGLYWERFGGGFKQAVRWLCLKNWKAVRNPSPRLLDEPLELYDLDGDIGEENDVAAEHPDVIAEIEYRLTRYSGGSHGSCGSKKSTQRKKGPERWFSSNQRIVVSEVLLEKVSASYW